MISRKAKCEEIITLLHFFLQPRGQHSTMWCSHVLSWFIYFHLYNYVAIACNHRPWIHFWTFWSFHFFSPWSPNVIFLTGGQSSEEQEAQTVARVRDMSQSCVYMKIGKDDPQTCEWKHTWLTTNGSLSEFTHATYCNLGFVFVRTYSWDLVCFIDLQWELCVIYIQYHTIQYMHHLVMGMTSQKCAKRGSCGPRSELEYDPLAHQRHNGGWIKKISPRKMWIWMDLTKKNGGIVGGIMGIKSLDDGEDWPKV